MLRSAAADEYLAVPGIFCILITAGLQNLDVRHFEKKNFV